MARPPKYNKARHESICKSLEAGMSRTTAAELAGIDRGTLEDWRDRYPAFHHDVTQSIAKAKARASVTITTAIRNGDVNAAFRYLSLQERSDWREQNDVNVTHSGTVNHHHRDLSRFTDDEIAALSDVAERVKAGTVTP